jgi:hypothetical protein
MKIQVDNKKIAEFCNRHHIRKLSFFGSVLDDNFGPDSDIDVLVEFKTDHIPGFIRLYEIEQELSKLLGGRKIDLVTPKFLHKLIREKVIKSAEVQYAEG